MFETHPNLCHLMCRHGQSRLSLDILFGQVNIRLLTAINDFNIYSVKLPAIGSRGARGDVGGHND